MPEALPVSFRKDEIYSRGEVWWIQKIEGTYLFNVAYEVHVFEPERNIDVHLRDQCLEKLSEAIAARGLVPLHGSRMIYKQDTFRMNRVTIQVLAITPDLVYDES